MKTSQASGPTAVQVAVNADLSEETRGLLREGQPAVDFIEQLIVGKKHQDAAQMISCLLPKREAIWWALQCARQGAGERPPVVVERALKAVEAWVTDLSDEMRRAAWGAANAAGVTTAAGLAAFAVYFSGGSLTGPDQDPFPPDERISARMVAGSIILSATASPVDQMQQRFESCLQQGLDLHRQLKEQ